MRFTRITIVRSSTPKEGNVNFELQWFGESIGLFNKRDKDRSCFRIFITLLDSLKKSDKGMTSDEIAEQTDLSRGTVVHHLNKLMSSGIVTANRNRYVLKVDSLQELIGQIETEVEQTFDNLKRIAEDIDKRLGL
ncbi:MAG: winged helix-turn-helix domain-containing protein [Candidatus Woesearchaeota archaeon]